MKKANFIAKAGLIAAFYATLTLLLAPFSYGQVQVRISEVLTVLAYTEPAAIPGLFVGCLIANFIGSTFGAIDIYFGSFLTLAAAAITYALGLLFRKHGKQLFQFIGPLFALLPVVIFNALGVALILKIAAKLPYWPSLIYVGIGEFIAVYILGYPFLQILFKTGILKSKK